MKTQNGFVPMIILVIIAATILVSAGGYVVYKRNFVHDNSVNTTQKDEAESQGTVTADQNTTNTNTTDSSFTETKQATNVLDIKNCDNNLQCLATAALQCNHAIGIITYSNVPNPIFNGFVMNGETKYEIKNDSGCTLMYSSLKASFSITAGGKANMISSGMTETEINSQISVMNESLKESFGIITTCKASGKAIASFLNDTYSGNFETKSSTDLLSGTSQSTYTTSIGEKLNCTTPQPAGTWQTY